MEIYTYAKVKSKYNKTYRHWNYMEQEVQLMLTNLRGAFTVVFQEVSKWSGRILPHSINRKSLRGRVSPLSLVQFRLGTSQ